MKKLNEKGVELLSLQKNYLTTLAMIENVDLKNAFKTGLQQELIKRTIDSPCLHAFLTKNNECFRNYLITRKEYSTNNELSFTEFEKHFKNILEQHKNSIKSKKSIDDFFKMSNVISNRYKLNILKTMSKVMFSEKNGKYIITKKLGITEQRFLDKHSSQDMQLMKDLYNGEIDYMLTHMSYMVYEPLFKNLQEYFKKPEDYFNNCHINIQQGITLYLNPEVSINTYENINIPKYTYSIELLIDKNVFSKKKEDIYKIVFETLYPIMEFIVLKALY